jgi:hypothetical protein
MWRRLFDSGQGRKSLLLQVRAEHMQGHVANLLNIREQEYWHVGTNVADLVTQRAPVRRLHIEAKDGAIYVFMLQDLERLTAICREHNGGPRFVYGLLKLAENRATFVHAQDAQGGHFVAPSNFSFARGFLLQEARQDPAPCHPTSE